MSVRTAEGLRARRHAESVAEIKVAALDQVAEHGPDGLSLRAVARAVGVSAQALYHYFPSRDALVTALVADSFAALAAAVRDASAATTGRHRIVAGSLAYRRWALENRSAFLLVLGVPLPDYEAPADGPTSTAAAELGSAFADAIFGDLDPADVARIPTPPGLRGAAPTDGAAGLPAGALVLFTTGWARLHGLVMLEVLGHLPWPQDSAEELCRAMAEDYADEVRRAASG